MFFFKDDLPSQQMFQDVKRTVMARTDHLMLCQLELDEGHKAPIHHHFHEQCSYVVSGKVEITLGDECRILQAGDSVGIKENVEHMYHALENSRILEAFYPLRDDILKAMECKNK